MEEARHKRPHTVGTMCGKSTSSCQGLGEGGWGMLANGDRSPCGEMEELWDQIELVVAQHSEWTKCYLKMVKIVSFMFSECYHNF